MDKEELKKAWEEAERERLENNDKILQIPSGLSPEEQAAYSSIAETIKQSVKYRLTSVDAELIWQYQPL